MYKRLRVLLGIGVLSVVFAGCQSGAAPSPAAPSGDDRIGGTVSVLATWGGDEQESFLAMVKPFEERTGIEVQYEGTRDLAAVLTTRVQGGNPPDVAGLPSPAQMAAMAKAGNLIDLGTVLDVTTMRSQYSEDWLKLAQVDGKQVGIFVKAALKGLVWYRPAAFKSAGYSVPKTWDDLTALSKRIEGSGTTPWCVGLESGAASGWPGTDWIENILLRQSGPDAYERWYNGDLAWTSPEVRKAWETWGQIVANPKMVYGGRQAILATSFQDAGNPLFTNPPQCLLHQQASFITGFFQTANPALKAGQDYTFFGFPDIDQKYAGAVEGGGDLFGMFKDTPQARALMQWLVTPEAQTIWVKRGGALSPNNRVALEGYPDDISRQSAEILTSAKIVRFDASDQMPEAVNQAFWKGVLDYVNDPNQLTTVLQQLDRVQADSKR